MDEDWKIFKREPEDSESDSQIYDSDLDPEKSKQKERCIPSKGKRAKTSALYRPTTTANVNEADPRKHNEIIATVGSDVDSSDSESEIESDVDLDLEGDVKDILVDVQARRTDAQGGATVYAGWTDDLTGFPNIPTFSAIPGLHTDIDKDNYSVKSCYQLFVTDYLVQLLKEETNRYASYLSETPPYNAQKHVQQWKTVTIYEMKGFLLIVLHMGLLKLPSIKDYWANHEFVKTSFARQILSRDRFRAILTMLHFSNNYQYIPLGQPNHDPLFKVRQVYEHLQERFQTVYTPEREVALDEAICPWRGHLRFKVYMKDKPTPWGIKFYELCEASSSYVYRFEIYAAEPGVSNRPTDVVMRIMDPVLDKGYHLFTDNYYTCPELYNQLTDRGTSCTGTVRSNRKGMPKPDELRTPNVGDRAFKRKGELVALKWKDKREVHILTSAVDPAQTTTVTTRNSTNKIKPTAVAVYSQNMSGVDRNDQLLSYSPMTRGTAKWPTKVFIHMYTLCVIQASIIYNKLQEHHGKKKMQVPEFIKQLGKELLEDNISERPMNRPPPKPAVKPTLLRLDHTHAFHMIELLPPTPKNHKPRRECKVCRDSLPDTPFKRKRAQETFYWCPACEIPMCIGKCYKKFHTLLNYSQADQ